MPPRPLSLTSTSHHPCSLSAALLTNRYNNQLKQNTNTSHQLTTTTSKKTQRNGGRGRCRAGMELAGDAPVAMAIGACILNSLVFPLPPPSHDLEAEESLIDSSDARFAVMAIISFIPYFNWMSWVFAWMDTGRRRYAVYAIVYLAPYLRSHLSISPEDSWLPIASIALCIFHIQLEASIKNGDVQGFQVFNEMANRFSFTSAKKEKKSFEEDERELLDDLPSHDDYRNEIQGWSSHKRQLDHEISNEGEEEDN